MSGTRKLWLPSGGSLEIPLGPSGDIDVKQSGGIAAPGACPNLLPTILIPLVLGVGIGLGIAAWRSRTR